MRFNNFYVNWFVYLCAACSFFCLFTYVHRFFVLITNDKAIQQIQWLGEFHFAYTEEGKRRERDFCFNLNQNAFNFICCEVNFSVCSYFFVLYRQSDWHSLTHWLHDHSPPKHIHCEFFFAYLLIYIFPYIVLSHCSLSFSFAPVIIIFAQKKERVTKIKRRKIVWFINWYGLPNAKENEGEKNAHKTIDTKLHTIFFCLREPTENMWTKKREAKNAVIWFF